ncbi:MAG: hypothetical protein ACE5DK_04400 [Paracoccaceae bacterium]
MTRLITAIVLLTFLVGCAGLRDSRMNPRNWFGRSKEETLTLVQTAPAEDPSALVAEVVSLRVDRLPGGAIIHAVGLPATQGHWQAVLEPLNGELPDKGMLIYEFRLMPPPTPEAAGTKRSREVLVGRFLSSQTLIGVRRIQVIAQKNRRTVRR